jgi:hypothetical protein
MGLLRPKDNEQRLREGVSRAVLKAIVSSFSAGEVLEHFDATFRQDYEMRSWLLRRIEELELRGDAGAARKLIQKIEAATSHLPIPKLRSADGTIAHLALLLTSEEQLRMAADFIEHPRRSRRLSGYKLLKRHRDHGLKDLVAASYRRYGDEPALIALLYTGNDVSDILDSPRAVVAQLTERYHQALAIERLWVRDEHAAWELAEEFPMAFIWAAGRRREARAFDFALRQLEIHRRKAVEATSFMEYIPAAHEFDNVVWALGRVGGRETLERLAKEFSLDVSALA